MSSQGWQQDKPLTEEDAWIKLKRIYETQHDSLNNLRDGFQNDSSRFDKYHVVVETSDECKILLDYSKNRINDLVIQKLMELARVRKVEEARSAMFAGDRINVTEKRPVLHTALRNRSSTPVYVDGKDVMPQIRSVLEQMKDFCARIQSGKWTGYTGQKITDVVNIGIGGSDLGPYMVCEALFTYAVGPNVHFVSNVDGTDIATVIHKLNPETTLFVVASKTFTTQETLVNATTAKEWLLKHSKDRAAIAKHFVAVTTATREVEKFNSHDGTTICSFEFWDFVGGRYSLWCAIGLPIALRLGYENFEEFLLGAHFMDVHFQTAPLEQNIPVILAMLGIWYANFYNSHSTAVLPYMESLYKFPAYLQQLDMESNGKSVTRGGQPVNYQTGPVLWGERGTNCQHNFYQLLHQGTKLIPTEFIGTIKPDVYTRSGVHHEALLSHVVAQPEVLLKGKSFERAFAELEKAGMRGDTVIGSLPYRMIDGNKPSTTILVEKLTPYFMGVLVALYEHKIFVQGVIWDINSFDQWGVELGKQLSKVIEPELRSDEPITSHDSSTNGLIQFIKEHRKTGRKANAAA